MCIWHQTKRFSTKTDGVDPITPTELIQMTAMSCHESGSSFLKALPRTSARDEGLHRDFLRLAERADLILERLSRYEDTLESGPPALAEFREIMESDQLPVQQCGCCGSIPQPGLWHELFVQLSDPEDEALRAVLLSAADEVRPAYLQWYLDNEAESEQDPLLRSELEIAKRRDSIAVAVGRLPSGFAGEALSVLRAILRAPAPKAAEGGDRGSTSSCCASE